MPDVDPFLAEAERRGLVTAAQAQEIRDIAAALAAVQTELSIDEIAARKGYVGPEQAAEIRRALARLRVGRYEVIEKLGEGAAGVVWRARDVKLDRIVALKILSQRAQSTPEFRERFLREARIAVTLNHVNIVRGLDYGEGDGYRYFAMELVAGENVETRLARLGRIPEKEAVSMALDVVRALQYVQKFRLVHRDIKPGNLILGPGGHVKLGDLGLAKPLLAADETAAGDGTTAGTPFYMSPEQIKTPDAIDWRSDVYGLGATLYHLLTGVPPFRPGGGKSVLQKHLEDPPENPREHALEISADAAGVVMRMLQKSPDARCTSLEELAADLEAVLAGRKPLHVAPPVPPDEATADRHARLAIARRITAETLPAERFPWPVVACFVLLLVAMIATGVRLAANAAEPKAGPTPVDPAPRHARDPVDATSTPPSNATTVAPPPRDEPSLDRRAADEFESRKSRAQPLVETGRFNAARALMNEFPKEFADTKAAPAAAAEAGRYDMIARGRAEGLVADAKRAARERRFDDARDLLDEAARVETPTAEALVLAARPDIEASRVAYVRARETQGVLFADLYGRALLAAGAESVATATAIVDKEAPALDAYVDETADLRRDLDLLARNGTETSRFDDHDARGALVVLLGRLAHGEIVQAERAVEAVGRTGGDVDEARARVQRVRGTLARRADELLVQADAARAAKRFDSAIELAERARNALPDYAPMRVMFGRIRLDQGRVAEALQRLGDLAREPDAPPDAHLWYGRALAADGKKEDLARAEAEIREFLDESIAKDPLRPSAEASFAEISARRFDADVKQWRERAKEASMHGRAGEAEGAWGRVAEISPDDVEALTWLGERYLADPSRQAAAFVVYSRLARVAPDEARRKWAADRAASLAKSGWPTDDGRALVAIGDRMAKSEDWSGAAAQYSGALHASPYLSAARVGLVRAHLARFAESRSAEDARAAFGAADALVALYPDDASALTLRSTARLAKGADAQHALDDATKAATLDKTSAPAALAQARAQFALGDPSLAATTFQTAYRLDPGPEALLGLALCHEKRRDPDAARGVLETLVERFGRPRGALGKEYDALMERLAGGR
jgi:serine/threonine-protein kinase